MRTRSPRPRLCLIASVAVLALLGGLVPIVPSTAVAAPGELLIGAVVGGEAEEQMLVTFERDRNESAEALSAPVQLAITDGAEVATATIGVDVSTVQTTLEFAAGETSTNLSVDVLDDGLFEGPEVVDVLVALGGAIQRFTVTVADSTVPKLSITPSTGLIGEGATATVGVQSSVAPVNPLAVTVRTVSGTADVGDDVEALDALLVLPAGATSTATVDVTAVDDLVADRFEERFDLAAFLGDPADVAPDATPLATRTMRIVDNDPYLRFRRSPGQEGANIHRIEVTEPLDGSAQVSVPIELLYDEHPYFGIGGEMFLELIDSGPDALGPTVPRSDLGTDLTIDRVPFDGFTTSPAFTVSVASDDVDEPVAERIRLGLRHELFCDCGWSMRRDDVIEIVINESAAEPEPFVFSSTLISGDTISERSGRATMAVRRDVPSTAPAELRIVTVPGTATPGIDYRAVDTVVTLDATPSQSYDIEVDLFDDPLLDDRQLETFSVQVFHLDSGRSDAATTPVLEQTFNIEDDEAPFAFDTPTLNVERPSVGTSVIELPLRRLSGDWTLIDPDTDAPQPIMLTATFADPGAAAAAGASMRLDTLVLLPGDAVPSFLVDIGAGVEPDAAVLEVRLTRTPRFSGPPAVWDDGQMSLVVGPPSTTVGDDVRAAIAAVFDGFASWTPQFDLGRHEAAAPAIVPGVAAAPAGAEIELPVLDTDIPALLELAPAADLLTRASFDTAADTLDQLLVDLEANGCTTDFVAGGLGGRPAASPGDVIQTTCAINSSTVSPTGDSPINDAVSELYQWLIDQPRTFGNLDVAGQLGASITVGVDADGPYVAGRTGLALDVSATGTLVTSVDGVVSLAASGTASADLDIGLALHRDDTQRVRLDDLADAVEAGLAPSVSGTAAATAQANEEPVSLRSEFTATVTTTPSGVIDVDESVVITGEVALQFPRRSTDEFEPDPAPRDLSVPIVGTLRNGQLDVVGSIVDDADLLLDGFLVREVSLGATLRPRADSVGPLSIAGTLHVEVNNGFEPVVIVVDATFGADRIQADLSIEDDTADFGFFVLDNPTWSVAIDTRPPTDAPYATIGLSARRLVANVGEETIIDGTTVTGTVTSSGTFAFTMAEGVLGGEDSAIRFDVGGLAVRSPDENDVILRADVISAPVPLLGEGATATVRDLVVSSDLRIGASSVELEQGVLSDDPVQIAGFIPVELGDVALRFTERDADGFITDLGQFELDVEAFVTDDAFEQWPFDVVLQLGGEVIRRDSPPADRRIGFSAAVDSVAPLRVRPIDLGPITFGIEGLGAPVPEDPDIELPQYIDERNGILQLVDLERTPPPGLGFILDGLITIDGYEGGVLQPGVEGLFSVTYGDGLFPEQGVSLIGDIVTTPQGDAGLDLQIGFLADVDLSTEQTDGLFVDDLEFVLSLRFGAAMDDPQAAAGFEVEFLGVRAEAFDVPFGSLFDVSATDIDLDLSIDTVFGDDADALLLSVGGDVADSGSGATIIAGDDLGAIAGWGGQAGNFAVTRSGGLVALDDFFVGLAVPEPEEGSGWFGLPDWLPLYVEDLAVEFGAASLAQIDPLTELTPSLLDDLRIRVSGGLRATEVFPIDAAVDDLVVDIGKLVTFDPATGFDADEFPIQNLAGVRFGIQPGIDFGGVTIGGNLTFGTARVPVEAFNGDTVIESVLYGRIAGYAESPLISGGVDVVVSQYGPVLLELTAPLGIPIGPTGFVLTDVTGAATFGDVAIDAPDLGAPEQLLGALDGNLPTDVEITPASIAAAVRPSVQLGQPTWDDGFALAVSGTLSNVAAGGLASGEVTLAVTVGAPEPGRIVPGFQAIGFGNLEVFGIELTESIELSGEVGRAGIMFDLTDVRAPRVDLAFETPSPGSPIGLIFPARATVAGQLDLTGLPAAMQAGTRSLVEAAGPAIGPLVEQFVVDNPSTAFAIAIGEATGSPIERLQRLLDNDPAVVIPAVLAMAGESFGAVTDTIGALKAGARRAVLAADAEFDPSFVFQGAVQPVLLGIPVGDPESEVKITIDKDNISFGATGSLIEALKDQVGMYTLSGDLAGGLFALSTLNATDRLTFDVQIPVPDLRSVLVDGGSLAELDPTTTSTQFAVQVEGDLTVAGMTMSVGGLYTAPDNATFLDTLVQRRFELPPDAPVDADRVQITRQADYEQLIARGGLLLYGRLQVPRLITDPVGVTQDLPALPDDAFGLLEWFTDLGDEVTATDEPVSATLFVPGLPAVTGRASVDESAIDAWMNAISFTGVLDGTARTSNQPRVARLLSMPIGTGQLVATTAGLEITADVPLAGTAVTFVAAMEERTLIDRRRGRVTAVVPVVSFVSRTTSQAAIDGALDAIGLPSVWQPSANAALRLEGYSIGFDPAGGDTIRRRGGVAATVDIDLPGLIDGASGRVEITPGANSGLLDPDFTASLDVGRMRVPGLRLTNVELDLQKSGSGFSGSISGLVDVTLPGVVMRSEPFASAFSVDGDFGFELDRTLTILGSSLAVDLEVSVADGELAAVGSAVGQLSIGALDLASGTFVVEIDDGVLTLTVPADDPVAVDVFNVASAEVSGTVTSTGAYSLAGRFQTIGATAGISWSGDVDVALSTGGAISGSFDGRVTAGGLSGEVTADVSRLPTGQGQVTGVVRVDLDGDGDFGGVFNGPLGSLPEAVPFTFVLGAFVAPDVTAPVFSPVEDITVTVLDNTAVPVEFEPPTAIDDRDGELVGVCSPGSGVIVGGSVAASLNRTVVCTATDAAGNSSTTSFEIDVQTETIEIEVVEVSGPVVVIVSVPPPPEPPPPPMTAGSGLGRGRAFVFSTPQTLGEFDVGDDGSITFRAVLPDLDAGQHHIAMYTDDRAVGRSQIVIPLVIGPSGELVTILGDDVSPASPPSPVAPGGGLPATGGDVASTLISAALLLLLGLGLVGTGRRRRRRHGVPG